MHLLAAESSLLQSGACCAVAGVVEREGLNSAGLP